MYPLVIKHGHGKYPIYGWCSQPETSIDIADFPASHVWLPEGSHPHKIPWNHHVPMVFLRFSYGFVEPPTTGVAIKGSHGSHCAGLGPPITARMTRQKVTLLASGCGSQKLHDYIYVYIYIQYTYIYVYIYIYICVYIDI